MTLQTLVIDKCLLTVGQRLSARQGGQQLPVHVPGPLKIFATGVGNPRVRSIGALLIVS